MRRLRHTAISAGTRRMRRARVKFTQQETRLTATGITHNETGEREPVLDKLSRILLGLVEQGAEVLVALLLLIPCFTPLGDCFPVEDENVEECVEEKDVLGLDGGGVEQDWGGGFLVEGVAVEGGLDHDEGVADVFVVKDVAVEGGLIGGVVEDLEKIGCGGGGT